MVVKWASFLFWNVIEPTLRVHFRYFRYKVAVDQYLERQRWWVNLMIGFAIGWPIGICIVACRPTKVQKSLKELERDALETFAQLRLDVLREMPLFALWRVQHTIMTAAHEANDRVEARGLRFGEMMIHKAS